MAVVGWGWREDQRPYPRLRCEREPEMDSSNELLGFLATHSAIVLVSVAGILAVGLVDPFLRVVTHRVPIYQAAGSSWHFHISQWIPQT